MVEKNAISSSLFKSISNFASRLDDQLRLSDFKWNRTAGGLLDRAFGITRYSFEYLLLPALIAGIIVMGVPEFGIRMYLAFFASFASFLLFVFLARLSTSLNLNIRIDLLLQVAFVSGLAAIIWMKGGDAYQKGGGVYKHFFVMATFVISAALVVAAIFSRWVWTNIQGQNNYDKALINSELFVSRDKEIPLGWGQLLRSFLTVIQGAPLQLLLFPSFIILFAPADYLDYIAIGAVAVSYGILLLGGIDSRLYHMWRLVQSIFFRGGALLVSLMVIALAVARLFNVSYVTTIFDTAEGGVIAILLCNAYVLFWWYDYWVNRLLAQELIKFIEPQAGNKVQIPYPISFYCVKTSVLQKERVLQIHGASRFIVIGQSKEHPCCFHTYTFAKLFENLAISGFPGGKATPSPGQINERIFDFKCLAGSSMALLTAVVGVFIHFGVQEPQLKANNQFRPKQRLVQIINDHARSGNEQPALLIAASGGGTRAALYTAAVLEGLAERGQIQDVIMGSGVSGGGAALAFFAGNRPALVDAKDNAWGKYFDVFQQPFIQDVIDGALEWRIVSRYRLGRLLSESFKNRWGLVESSNNLGEVNNFGLILNTAIAGRFACDGTSEDCNRLPLIKAERCFRKEMTHSEMSGGRLILTNLLLRPGFVPNVETTGGPKGLPVVVDDPDTRLEDAAALNANFPPVFSNAAIDVGDKTRYWVTDGGVVDNRGIEMLLYALLDALHNPNEVIYKGHLPAITVVVVDASAFSNKYSQDRGIGTMMGAGTQYASLLVEEQLRSIRALYDNAGQSDRFKFVYFPMPLCLRESGSFGTHWMLQPSITVELKSKEHKRIKGEEMVELLRVMHSPGQKRKLSPDAQSILKHAVTDDRWRIGARELGFIR